MASFHLAVGGLSQARRGGRWTLVMLVLGCVSLSCAEGSEELNNSDGAGASGEVGGATAGGGGNGAGSTGGVSTGAQASGGYANGGSGGLGPVAQGCDPGEFAYDVDATGTLLCEPIADTVATAARSRCGVYMGWRDSCSGCNLPPTRWGSVAGPDCTNGLGATNTCSQAVLGGANITLFGLNTGGDVNDDDKFYIGLSCPDIDSVPTLGACGAGQVITGFAAGEPLCVPAATVIADYVATSCSIYYGWRDSCDACTTAPSRWGRVSSTTCANGLGATNSCTAPVLGGTAVEMFGLNTGGDVDGNDKFHIGLHCEDAMPASSTDPTTCPTGQVVVGLETDGSVVCESPAPQIAPEVQSACSIYAGWRDSCGNCGQAPTKWGRVSHGDCENGVGVANTCVPTPLGGTTVQLFGLNMDGEVNDDDKFYFGWDCQ